MLLDAVWSVYCFLNYPLWSCLLQPLITPLAQIGWNSLLDVRFWHVVSLCCKPQVPLTSWDQNALHLLCAFVCIKTSQIEHNCLQLWSVLRLHACSWLLDELSALDLVSNWYYGSTRTDRFNKTGYLPVVWPQRWSKILSITRL